MNADKCPICNSPSQLYYGADGQFGYKVNCPRCGVYLIGDRAKACVEKALQMGERELAHYLQAGDGPGLGDELYSEFAKKAVDGRGVDIPKSILSHILRERIDKKAPLTNKILADILKNNSLPTPAEQANNLIKYLAEHLSSPGHPYEAFARQSAQDNIYGIIGIKTGENEWKDFQFLIEALGEQKYLNAQYENATSGGRRIPLYISLTLAGWQLYEELQRSVKNSRKAFVAMEFSNPEKTTEDCYFQDTLLDTYLVPAAKKILCGWTAA